MPRRKRNAGKRVKSRPNQNHLFMRSKRLYYCNKPVKYSKWYRTAWKPLLGHFVLIEGTYTDHRDINLGGYGIRSVLLKNVSVIRSPKEFSGADFGITDHIWVLLDRHLLSRIGASVGQRIRCSGFVTEYTSYTDHEAEYKNISVRVKNADVVRTGKELLYWLRKMN